VPYAYNALRTQLGLSRETLDEHGAVSEPATRELAQRARDVADATWGLATTGIAGPSGGDANRPVGTVLCAVAYAGAWGERESWTSVETRRFDGDRQAVRTAGVRLALEELSSGVERVVTGDGQ
jgi:nicotinamide-nucleotide amidase